MYAILKQKVHYLGDIMAIIYEGKNKTGNTIVKETQTYTKHKNILLLLMITVITIIIISILMDNEYILITLLIFPIGFLMQQLFKYEDIHHNHIERIGEIGEQKALDIFRQLDNSYTIFHNINIQYDGKTSQLDNILICKYGIFIIEIKNMNGHIFGSCDDYELTQEKISHSKEKYESTFYNPIKQVNTHIYRLSNYLRLHGIRYYINGMVFFVNEDVTLDIVCDDTPVFDIYEIDELFYYIQSFSPDLSKQKQIEISKILMNLL